MGQGSNPQLRTGSVALPPAVEALYLIIRHNGTHENHYRH